MRRRDGIDAGELRDRIQFQRKTVAADALNQEIATWSDYGDRVWARVTPLSGRAVHAADQMQEPITIEIKVRKLASPVSRHWRVIWDDRTLSVDAVLPLGRNEGYRLLCSENTVDNTEGARGA